MEQLSILNKNHFEQIKKKDDSSSATRLTFPLPHCLIWRACASHWPVSIEDSQITQH